MQTRTGTKFIAELPMSKKPWRLAIFNGYPVLINEDHDPLILVDDKLRKLVPSETNPNVPVLPNAGFIL